MRRVSRITDVDRDGDLPPGVLAEAWIEDGQLHIVLSKDLTPEAADAERDRIVAKHRRRRGFVLPVAGLGRKVAMQAREHTRSTVAAGTTLVVAGAALAVVALPPALNGQHHAPLAGGPRPTVVAPPPQPPRSLQPLAGPLGQPTPPAPGTVQPPAAPTAPSRTAPRPKRRRRVAPPTTPPPSAAPPAVAPPPAQAAATNACLLNLELLRTIRIRICL